MNASGRLVRGGWIATPTADGTIRVIEDGAIYHEFGVIKEVGSFPSLRQRYTDSPVTGEAHHVVIPGLVNAHHHAFAPSIYRQCSCDDPLEYWLLDFFWRPTQDPYLTTLQSGLTLLESGVTTTLHCHYSKGSEVTFEKEIPRAIEGYRDSGIRVSFGPEITDRKSWGVYECNGEFVRSLPAHLQEEVSRFSTTDEKRIDPSGYFALFEQWAAKYTSDRVRLIMRPVVPHYCSDDLLLEMKRYAHQFGVGIHINIYESQYQRMFAQKLYGESVVTRLNRLEFFDSRVSCAHCVWLDDEDIRILAESKTNAVTLPSSNLRLGSGIAPVVPMKQRGLNVGIGIDALGINDDEDMLQEMRLSMVLNQVPGHGNESLSSEDVFLMATRNGARATFWEDKIGTLEPGKHADLVLLDGKALYEPFHGPRLSVVDDLLQLARRTHVDIVLVDGEEAVRGGRAVAGSASDLNRQLAEEYDMHVHEHPHLVRQRQHLCDEIKRHLRRYYVSWGKLPGTPHYRYN